MAYLIVLAVFVGCIEWLLVEVAKSGACPICEGTGWFWDQHDQLRVCPQCVRGDGIWHDESEPDMQTRVKLAIESQQGEM